MGNEIEGEHHAPMGLLEILVETISFLNKVLL